MFCLRSIILLTCGHLFLAITPSDLIAGPLRQSEHILQQEQQRQAEEHRRLEEEQRRRSKRKTPDIEPQEEVVPGDKGHCFQIDRIELNGVKSLSNDKIQALLTDYSGQCLSVSHINEILKIVTKKYIAAGYVTTRAYLKPQNLKSGTLSIEVIEGKLEGVYRRPDKPLGDDARSDAIGFAGLFTGLQGRMLNLRDLEQNLEQINRLRSRKAAMELLPGSVVGSTLVEVQEKRQRPWQISVQLDNSGQKSTGKQQRQLMVSWDSPLALYDYTYLYYQFDAKHDRDGKKSESIGWHWDVPLGYWNIGVDVNSFEYLSTVQGVNQRFECSGRSQTQQVGVSRVLWRDGNDKLSTEFSLTRKKNENYIEDALIETGSRTLALATVGLKQEHAFSNRGFLLSELTYHRGMRLFGSPDDRDRPSRHTPQAQFNKYTACLDYQLPLNFAGHNWHCRTRWVGQYSPEILFGTEEISIGSLYSVRGYNNSISSRSGSYLRNDFTWLYQPGWGGKWLTRLFPSIGLDIGMIRDYDPAYREYEFLKGIALGLKAAGSYWTVELTVSRAWDAPGYLSTGGDEFDIRLQLIF